MHFLHRRHLFIAILLLFTLVVNAGIAGLNIARLVRNERGVARTYAILAGTENIVSAGQELENSARGFVILGNPRFFEAFQVARSGLDEAVAQLERNASDPDEQLILPSLKLRVARHAEFLRRAMELRRLKSAPVAQRFLSGGQSKRLQEESRGLAAEIQTREQEILQERADESTDASQNATRTFWIASGANLLFLGVVLGLLFRASQQNVQLDRAFSDLKRAESMRDGLTEMLVHDLRTPLTTLLGPLQMLHAGALGELSAEQTELVAMSHGSGERLLKLVNELLDISKMEAGELKIKAQPVEIEALFHEARRELATGEATAPLSTEIAPDLPPVYGDRDLLVRILINLLSNALKFTPKDGKVTLSAARDATNPNFARFEVRDSGEGIPAEDLEKIFDKFGQVETRKAGRKMSTGLGLTFCKLAVETHGGKIWVESEVGQGSVFRFTIPFVKSDP